MATLQKKELWGQYAPAINYVNSFWLKRVKFDEIFSLEFSIKNMVCARCIKTVTGIFQQAGAEIKNVKLGTVETSNLLDAEQLNTIRKNLVNEGFELLDDQKMKLIEQIKNEIINLVHYGDLDELTINLSTLLSKKLLTVNK